MGNIISSGRSTIMCFPLSTPGELIGTSSIRGKKKGGFMSAKLCIDLPPDVFPTLCQHAVTLCGLCWQGSGEERGAGFTP